MALGTAARTVIDSEPEQRVPNTLLLLKDAHRRREMP